MCNEYIINIQTSGDTEIFKIYHHNEKLAVASFISACDSYSRTGKEDAKSYWKELISSVDDGKYSIMRNYDFRGISKIV